MGEDWQVLTIADYRDRLATGTGAFVARTPEDATRIELAASSPILGTAVHAAHRIRQDLQGSLEASAEARFREEDPHTHRFLGLVPHTILPAQSRFEVDMNRSAHEAVYRTPEMAWGIATYKSALDEAALERSIDKWYEFHTAMDVAVKDAIDRFGRAVVLDVHSYNYQRKGPVDWRTDGKPVINLGTKHLRLDGNGRRLVDGFFESLQAHTVLGESALVQENGVFMGGYLNRRLSRRFGPSCITLSVEYKKVYMDEASGKLHEEVLEDLARQFDESLKSLAEPLGAPLRATRHVPALD